MISLLSKELSIIFSRTIVQKDQFFSAQPSLWSNSHLCLTAVEKHSFSLYGPLSAKGCLCFLICYVGHSFSSKEEASFNFMASVTICSDFGAQENKVSTVSIVSPSICHEVMGLGALILVFSVLSFKPAFSLSFALIKSLLCFLPSKWYHLHI